MVQKVVEKIVRKIYQFRIKRLKNKIGKVGEGVTLEMGSKIAFPERLNIGDNVYIGPEANIHALGKVTIMSGVIIGPRVRIYSANHQYKNATAIPYDENFDCREVIIGENVWIGGDVILVPGASLGEGSVIGAGSVVAGTVPPFAIAVGNPLRVINYRDKEHYEQLKNNGKIYMKLKNQGTIRTNYNNLTNKETRL